MDKAVRLTVALLGASAATLALAAGSSPEKHEPVDVSPAELEKLHSAAADDPNRFLVLGGVAVEPPRAGVSKDLRPFLGRWEGFNTNPPVKKDLKVALVVRSIDARRADAFIYYGFNLQFPIAVKHLSLKVSKTREGARLEGPLEPGGDPLTSGRVQLAIERESGNLAGELSLGGKAGNYVGSTSMNSVALSRGSSYFVYRDYPAYLAGLRITSERYADTKLNAFGSGYLVYLPPGYEAEPDRRWPLLLFLHGMGDRGDNVLLLAKASPFKMIREKGPLPFVIVAPLLASSPDFFSFPGAYTGGVLDEVTSRYRIDPKRVYLAGLSLGGEAAFRFSLEHPEKIAAMASVGGMLAIDAASYYPRELKELERIPLSRLADVPAWQIHGAGDAIVPVQLARSLVSEFASAGVKVRYTELADHEHDVWSDTFVDPEFYAWFLQHEKR